MIPREVILRLADCRAHYPHDPRVIDRFDEAGILFWSETIGPGVSVENTQDPVWMKFQIQQLGEMMDNAMNHASVLTWGWYVQNRIHVFGAKMD